MGLHKFTIKKGKHYSSPMFFIRRLLLAFTKTFEFTVEFNENCLYTLPASDKFDINKLFGVSCNTLLLHKNSIRFGWRCVDNMYIQLVSYAYIDGVRIPEQIIKTINVNEKVSCKMIFVDDQVLLSVTDLTDVSTVGVNLNKEQTWGIFLWPYFGGNNPAPHEMKMQLNFSKI